MLPQAVAVLALVVTAQPAPAGARAPAVSRFHLVRSTSGSRGTQEGPRFLIEDPRSVFHVGQDRQVLVLFEWQGPLGPHRCEGTWKDPKGTAVLTSRSELVARGSRFGVYWGLSIPDAVATGTWVLEAQVDGEPAGVHAFQIVAAPEDPNAPRARRRLAVAELYQRGLAATLRVEAVDGAGTSTATVSGLALASDLVLAPFSALNGARSVRVTVPDGRRLETSTIAAWQRHDDWALLRLPEALGLQVSRSANPPAVGDACYFLEAQADGSRVIIESNVLGRSATGDLVLSQNTEGASSGAPVFDEYGEVVGFLAAPFMLAGADVLDLAGLGSDPVRGATRGVRVHALPTPPEAGATARTLADLQRAGEFVRALATTVHLVSGVLGTGVAKDHGIPFAVGQRYRFSRADASCVTFVTWTPRAKQDATGEIVLFDDANRPLFKSPPGKLKLRPGNPMVQWWPVELARLKPGVYRIDALLDADPVWRTFFRLLD